MKRGDPDGPEGRRPGRPGPVLGTPRWLGDEPQGVLPRGPRAAAHAARRHRLRDPRGAHLDGPHRRQGLDLQGRHPALQGVHRREDLARGRHGRRRRRGCCGHVGRQRLAEARDRRRRPSPRRRRRSRQPRRRRRGRARGDRGRRGRRRGDDVGRHDTDAETGDADGDGDGVDVSPRTWSRRRPSPTSSRRGCAPTRRSSAAPRTSTTRPRTSARRWTRC